MKLAVLFGGISSEHDISCLSAASILRNLNKDKYEIYPVGITRDGEWFYCPDCDPDRVESGAWERMTGKVKVVLAPDRGMHGMVLLREGEIEIVRLDCVFPVLHGVGGEDGTMQGLLELAGSPNVGCGRVPGIRQAVLAGLVRGRCQGEQSARAGRGPDRSI